MKVSVIIPAYNEENYIGKTLESVKKQNFQGHEIIVVCNGCTDNTFSIAKRYTDKVFNLDERNVSKARNYGVAKASYKFLVFLDADVVLEPNVLWRVHNVMLRKRCFGTVKGRGGSFKNRCYLSMKNLVNQFIPWCHGFVFCNKNEFICIGGFNENMVKRELNNLFHRFKSKYARVNCYVMPSDRRLKQWGLGKIIWFWLFQRFRKGYEAVR